MPFAVLVLIFDRFAPPRLALFGGGVACGFKRFLVGGKAFREHPVDSVGPAILVADHLVSDVYHRLHLPRAPYQVHIVLWVPASPDSGRPPKRLRGPVVGFDMPAA